MTESELQKIIFKGETSKVQFKEKLSNADNIAAEIIALSNSKGGIILFGIEDKNGIVVGLDYDELQETESKLATIANDMIKPQVFLFTEVVSIENKNILVVNIEEGIAKPYKDRNGAIWLKQGADKRRLTDNNEQVRLFQQSGILYTDEMIIPDTSIVDVNFDKVRQYLEKIEDAEVDEIDKETVCKNLNIVKNGRLTLGGLLFFSKNPQKFRPAFCIKAVSFFGNDIGGTDYRGSVDINGTIPEMFERGMGFFTTYLKHTQQGQNFNSTGILEISEIALQELLQNALTHRDYSKNSPIRVLIFDDRVELISPGCLPNSLTVENIKMGNAVVRNNLIVSFGSKLMKYRGLGSGVRRAIKKQPNIELINDTDGEQFIVRIPRVES